MQAEAASGASEARSRPEKLLLWLESQPIDSQPRHAQDALDSTLQEAARPQPATSNAISKLSDFVKRCSKSDSACLRQWAFSPGVVEKLFESYVEWDESDQRRSTKVLLDLVVQLLKDNTDHEASAKTTLSIVTDVMTVIKGTSSKPIIKAAIKACDCFLAKGVISLEDLRDAYTNPPTQLSVADEPGVWAAFFAELMQWLRVPTVCPIVGKFIVALYCALRAKDQSSSYSLQIETFKQWLLDLVSQDPVMLEPLKNYIFGPLFKGDRKEALEFLRSLDLENITASQDLDLNLPQLFQLAAFEAGKRVGLVEEPDLEIETSDSGKTSVVLPEKILTSVLSHPSHEVRSLAFSLLITSPSTTRPYSTTALDLLRRYLGTYFADTDAKFRVDVISRSREMFKRIRGSICVLKRSIPRAKAKGRQKQGKDQATQPVMRHTNILAHSEAQLELSLSEHTRFLRWYILFLRDELIPTASYQRHVGSLKALSHILRMEEDTSKTWATTEDQELFFDLFDASWARALYDLIMDPFEDVRDLSAAALRTIFGHSSFKCFKLKAGRSSVEELRDLGTRCDAQARRTARADDSDGAARAAQVEYKAHGTAAERLAVLSDLIHDLESRLNVAERDLGHAVLDAPVHGKFAAVRYIWQLLSGTKLDESDLRSLKTIQDQIFNCCSRVWAAVRDILCDDSPEGHLPQELEDVDGLTTRDVLSYSFRSVHESSDLMRAIVLTLRNSKQLDTVSCSEDLFRSIGNLTFEQLSTLRHRGAFSTVSQTFAVCCQQTKYINVCARQEYDLLTTWYKGTLKAIDAQASTTRRSAGLPSLMTGILSANATSPSFDEVMQKLIERAGEQAFVRETDGSGSNLPQVHAFNCLKDIFKNSLLTTMGNKSENYITQCLQLAATGLKSEVWAIRNCSLILLRSLIDNLFGSNETKHMIEAGWDGKANRIAYYKYSMLPDLLVNLLEAGHQMMALTATSTAGAESVFPALDIIRRAGPPDAHRSELQRHIVKYLASPVWHVREMAARSFCSCLLHDTWFEVIKPIVMEALEDRTQNGLNYVHGSLLTLRFVFERLSEVSPDRIHAALPDLQSFLWEIDITEKYPHCTDVGALYFSIYNQMLAFGMIQSVSIKLPQRRPSFRSCGALLKVQTALFAVYRVFESEMQIEFISVAFRREHIGSDAVVAGLELISSVFKVSSMLDDHRVKLARLYVWLCLYRRDQDIQAAALRNLAELMDYFLTHGPTTVISEVTGKPEIVTPLGYTDLMELWTALPWNPVNPTLSDAIIRVSGCIMAIISQSSKATQMSAHASLRGWGLMMADAVWDDKEFDTRFAAVETLKSFFAAHGAGSISDEHLPALIALYDALNDDDDEVRDTAATAARYIVGQAAVPLEAANILLEFLASKLKGSAEFRSIVVARLVGARESWTPAAEQLEAALKVDDSLFAVEEQNLFIDEVRETKRWIHVLELLEVNTSDSSLLELDDWLVDGLEKLRLLFEQPDGPLGWSSRPQAFAVASSIILGSVSLVTSQRASTALRDKLRQAKEALNLNADKHVSGLLIQPLKEL